MEVEEEAWRLGLEVGRRNRVVAFTVRTVCRFQCCRQMPAGYVVEQAPFSLRSVDQRRHGGQPRRPRNISHGEALKYEQLIYFLVSVTLCSLLAPKLTALSWQPQPEVHAGILHPVNTPPPKARFCTEDDQPRHYRLWRLGVRACRHQGTFVLSRPSGSVLGTLCYLL